MQYCRGKPCQVIRVAAAVCAYAIAGQGKTAEERDETFMWAVGFMDGIIKERSAAARSSGAARGTEMMTIRSVGPPSEKHADRVVAEMLREIVRTRVRRFAMQEISGLVAALF